MLEGVFAEGEEELLTPPCAITGVEVEDDGDEAPNVLNGNSLDMQVQNSRRVSERSC